MNERQTGPRAVVITIKPGHPLVRLGPLSPSHADALAARLRDALGRTPASEGAMIQVTGHDPSQDHDPGDLPCSLTATPAAGYGQEYWPPAGSTRNKNMTAAGPYWRAAAFTKSGSRSPATTRGWKAER